MSELQYVDLYILNHDFSLNAGNEPDTCNNQISIGQDIVHAIYESGLVTQLVAERSPTLRADLFTQLELLVESDERIVPGSVVVQEETKQRLWITAETYDFGAVSTRAEL